MISLSKCMQQLGSEEIPTVYKTNEGDGMYLWGY